MAIEAVIFDKDGIIVETEQAHYESYKDAINELIGLDLSLDLYIQWGISRDYKEFLRDAFGDKIKESQYDDIEELKGKYYDNRREQGFKTVDGITALIQRLSGVYRLAIASSTPVESIRKDLDNAKIREDSFELLKSGEDEDVERNKPAPDIYRRVSEIMELAASKCVVIEDSISGIMAAKAAGMSCIARSYDFTPGKSDKEKEDYLKGAGADKVIKSYNQITVDMINSLTNQ